MDIILAPISLGELIDKITILRIKFRSLKGKAHDNAKKELTLLENIYTELNLKVDESLFSGLEEVNQRLWDIEDKVREKEDLNNFDEEFINLARSVYLVNDRRADLKKSINYQYQSAVKEEKIYSTYAEKL